MNCEKCRQKGLVWDREECRICDQSEMTPEEAKNVIRTDPLGNIARRLEAIDVAKKELGEDCTMADIWKWAEGK